MANSDGRLILYSVIGLAFGIFTFYKGLMKFKKKKLIEDIPTSAVRSIAMGLVEIFGQVVPSKGSIIVSPLTNKDCVYYTYEIEEYIRSGKRSRWVTVKKGSEGVHFFLKDKTGLVLVEPNGAEIEIKNDFFFESRIGRDPPQIVKDFMKKSKMSFEGLFGTNKTMRFTECVICPGDNVYILGDAADNPYVQEATAKSNVDDIMICKGDDAFYISDESEKELLSELGRDVYLSLAGGLGLSIVCLFIIMYYFNLLWL
jgi:hypothetical protein